MFTVTIEHELATGGTVVEEFNGVVDIKNPPGVNKVMLKMADGERESVQLGRIAHVKDEDTDD